MVSTFTPNIQIEEPARGDDVGTWDTPVNSNMTLIDLVAGGIATISGAAGSVVLATAQFRSKGITINSTLLASITVTFPTSFTKSYEIQHLCTGSSAFTITLTTTAVGGQAICCPPGETVDCFNDGVNIKFKNLGRVGQYWDYAGSSVPNWVSGCTIAPYLNCDGTTFSSGTYPALATTLGSTTLPDSRGRFRLALNQGTGRVTSSNGVDGNTAYASGGGQSHTLTAAEIPVITPTMSVNNISVAIQGQYVLGSFPVSGTPILSAAAEGVNNTSAQSLLTTGSVVLNSFGSGASHTIVNPTYVGGLTLIRAA